MPRDVATFTSGEVQPVDLLAVERELGTLWKSATESTDAGGRNAVTRACVMNLVVLVESERMMDEVVSRLSELAVRHPSRAIVLDVSPRSAVGEDTLRDTLESWISAHCHRAGPAGPQVCCEQITLRASGASVRHLPPTVASLLVPDLPLHFWCPGNPTFSDPLFERIAGMSDTVLVDSAVLEDTEAALSSLMERSSLPSGTTFRDLNWERLSDLREHLAQFFDPPYLREYPAWVDGIEITYTAPPGTRGRPAGAFLLAGWLASRLGLRPEGSGWDPGGTTGVEFQAQGLEGTVKIRISPESGSASAAAGPSSAAVDHGSIRSVLLRADHAATPATFRLVVADDQHSLATEVTMKGTCPIPRCCRIEPLAGAGLVSRALDRRGRDHTLAAALQVVAGIFGFR